MPPGTRALTLKLPLPAFELMRARNSGACSGMNNGAASCHAESPIVAIQHYATEDAFDQLGVDFSNASLYLAGIQTIFSISCCAVVSVLACWLVPLNSVSAVRTLVLCVACAVLLMRKPLRVGRVRGVNVVFASLQPAVGVYLLALVVEQLTHTCAGDSAYAPSWRRVVFHTMMLLATAAGFMRSRAPMNDTDLPFLLTAGALLMISLLPPPAVAFVGPLCQSVSLFEAADRLVRAFVFASVYCIHVYAMTPASEGAMNETLLIVTRAAAAAMWTLGIHLAVLPLAIAQCGLVILARLRMDSWNYSAVSEGIPASTSEKNDNKYHLISDHDSQALHDEISYDDLEDGGGLIYKADQVSEAPAALLPSPPQAPLQNHSPEPAVNTFGPLSFRELSGAVSATAAPRTNPSQPMTAERMAEIAASIVDE